MKYQNAFVRERNGRWQGVLKWKDADNKWHSKSKSFPDATGKQMAERLLAEWRQDEEGIAAIEPAEEVDKETTVGKFMTDYVDGLKASKSLERSTIIGYGTSLGYIVRLMGNVSLKSLTTARVQKFVNDLNKEGFSSSTVKKAYNLLGAGMTQAVRDGYIASSPCGRGLVRLPKKQARKPNSLDAQGRARLMGILAQMELATMTVADYIALYTGMRQGEVAALRWRNVDFDNEVIHVVGSIAQSDEGGTYEKGTKSNATRDIPLSKSLGKLLKDWHDQRFTEWLPKRVKGGKANEAFGALFVCGDLDGSHTNPHSIGKAWTELAKAFGINGILGERLTFHGLRHTFATLAIENGADVRSVSDILGHADVSVTLNIYADCSPQAKRRTIDIIDTGLKLGDDADVLPLGRTGTQG